MRSVFIKIRVLLHCCCAPCSAPILEWLLANGYKPVLFYYNPNIFPSEEYEIRKNELSKYASKLGVEVINGDYDHKTWLQCVTGHETDKERGARCQLCFDMRLKRTAEIAAEMGINLIATTLASSRWKSLEQIEKAGMKAVEPYNGMEFWAKNWRKDGLQERRRILLAENGFYNQLYCGCEFSIK
ncbi:MAG: epoxyqueuosine reductase QueH [Paludibacteraceae bacterium]|nr:epoxyqueuosine reductase QueH [Paludibacteraceae bacterium]